MQTEINRDKIDELFKGKGPLLAELIRNSGGIALRNSVAIEGSTYCDPEEQEHNDPSFCIGRLENDSTSLLKLLGFQP